jgi:LemA protein
MTLLAFFIGALLLFWGLGAYNRLMRLRNAIGGAWQQLEAPLTELVDAGALLAESGPRWLPQEGPAFDALRVQGQELQTAIKAVRAAPHAADPVAQLAVAHALHASAQQRVLALLEHAVVEDGEAERLALIARLRAAQQQRDFGKQLFNQRVAAFNEAVAEVPTRALAGLYGFHDAKSF